MKLRKNHIYTILIGAGLLLALPLYFMADPTEFDGWFPKCPVYHVSGLYCAGCGSQRALHDFLHLDFLSAIKHNILIPPALLTIGYHYYKKYREYRTGTPQDNLLYHPRAPWIIFIVIVVFMVLRNIPLAPFTYLSPA